MADNKLPDNDADLQLAQQIGEARAMNRSLSELDDTLLPSLLKHRKRVHQQQSVNQTDKQQVWQNISEAISAADNKAPVYQLFNAKTYRWAAVAVLLIGVLFSFLYIQFWKSPELLAQSGSSIETVQLDDGSMVTLRPHSKLFEVEKSASLLLYKLKGEALFKVTDKQDRTFSVKTANGRVSVLGTQFILSTWSPAMQIFLEEGLVKVASLKNDKVVFLQPGEAATVSAAGNINHMTKVNAQTFTDWLDQQLIFNSKLASQIVQELEQQFNITISLPDDIADNRLSGQLSLQSLDVALNDLSLVLGGTFVQTGKRSYRFEVK